MGLLFGLLCSIALAALTSKHKRQLLAKHNSHLVAVAGNLLLMPRFPRFHVVKMWYHHVIPIQFTFFTLHK